MALISVAELKEHISFLRAVHTESSHGDESLYADSKRLRAAVRTLEDEGMPVWNMPSEFGDMHITFQVQFLRTLTRKQKEKLATLGLPAAPPLDEGRRRGAMMRARARAKR